VSFIRCALHVIEAVKAEQPPPTAVIEGLVKGLQVLEAMAGQGCGSALQISRATGIPRPTVHRVLHTLIQQGYVLQAERGREYRLTKMITLVADGFKGEDWLYEASKPILSRWRSKISWPMDTAVCEGGWMVVCTNTHDLNPLSLDHVFRGRKVNLTASSLGRAYLAFAPVQESDMLIHSVTSELPEPQRSAEIEAIRGEMVRTRERGFALRVLGLQSKTSSIAVPVMHGDSVIACINIHWIDRAVSLQTAIDEYVPQLRQVAQELEAAQGAAQAPGTHSLA
jgi:IclR family mhp operon transcriptional activator